MAIASAAMCAGGTASSNIEDKPTINRSASASKRLGVSPVHLQGRHNGYTVDVRYPRFRGGPKSTVNELNRRIKRLVDMNIAAQKGVGETNYYGCDFKTIHMTPHLVSIDFEFHEGRLEFHRSFNYQLQPQLREIKLSQVFGKRPNLDRLSNLSLEKLEPKAEINLPAHTDICVNALDSFNFDSKGMLFHFEQGHVAAIAVGCPSARVDYYLMRDLFTRKSPLFAYVQKSHVARKRAKYGLRSS
jgi:hypothetical protein